MSYKYLNNCVICDSSRLEEYIDLGRQPLANNLLTNYDDVAEQYPLSVNFCRRCKHSQLSISVNPEILFKHYRYATGTSKAINEYFKWFVEYIESKFPGKTLNVLEIASNDGTLLKHFKDKGHSVVGVDPAENIAAIAELNGIKTIPKFWNEYVANEFKDKFDVIIAQNVLAHVPNPVEFMKACLLVVKDDGIISIQTSQANMFQNFEFDTVYHEHLSFFNALSFLQLSIETNSYISDIKKVPIHGTSYLVEFTKKMCQSESLIKMLDEEDITYLTFHKFKDNFNKIATETFNKIDELNVEYPDYTLCGFGAAAKGITFLNHTRIQPEFIVDDTPYKQGMFTPGMNIPIVSRDELKRHKNLAILILPWNFYDNIIEQLRDLKNKNQNFIAIRYFPKFEIEYL